ncbi:MAG: mitomycin antibiotic biosynthesis protein, partial [Candidatus Poribacteria bacterium]|nr:mitomycin antibiotic biosynthesis protein [Candidatus Poribacteria bacterium]
MSLTKAELQQFHEEGHVVKSTVFSRADLQPIKDALSEIIDMEAKCLQSEGRLEETFADAPFGTRLARIR